MKAWKVLIADDEPKIRRGLRGAVEDLGSDFQVVAEAEDGEVALELARETRPDILLVDIRMPILNGLELIERLGAISTDWIIIVVTGHDEFEYARQALKLKITDYLLKPVSRETFSNVMESARLELSARRKTDLYLEWSRDQLTQNLPSLREGFMRRLVAGSMSQSEIDENLEFLQLTVPLQMSMICFHLVERALGVGSGREGYRRLMLLTLKNLVSEAIAKVLKLDQNPGGLGSWRHESQQSSLPLVFEDDTETIIALLPPLDSATLAAFQAEIEQHSSATLHHTPSISVGTVVNGLGELPELFDLLSNELLERGNSESFIQLIQNYLETHFRKPDLTLEEVAAEIQLSPGYLSRILKQKTGASFIDYVTRLRIKKATQLMADPAARVFEIAERVGYRSQHYFSRAFKKVLGISPSDYRKSGEE